MVSRKLPTGVPPHLLAGLRSNPPDVQTEASLSHDQQQEQSREQQQQQQQQQEYLSPPPQQTLNLTEASILRPQRIDPAAEASLQQWQDIDEEIENHPRTAMARILQIIANRPKTPSQVRQARTNREQHLLRQHQQQQYQQYQPQQQQPQQPSALPRIRETPEDRSSALPQVKSKGKGKGKAVTIRIPKAPTDIESSWASLYIDNVKLRQHIREHEHSLNLMTSDLESAREELQALKKQAAAANPLISNLETALWKNESQLSLLQSEADNTYVGTLSAGNERLAAQREADHFRRLNNTLMNTLSTDRGKIAKLEAQMEQMKDELIDDLVEEQMRNAVLEAENEHLRKDIEIGMGYMQQLIRVQWEMSLELNTEDWEKAEDERRLRWQERQEGNEENLDKLGIEFRGDSIWEDWEAGPQPEPSTIAVDETDVKVSSVIQTFSPQQLPSPTSPSAPGVAAEPVSATVPHTATAATQTSPVSPNVVFLPEAPPCFPPAMKPIMDGPWKGTQTSPISPTVILDPEPSPSHHHDPGTTAKTIGPSAGTQTSPVAPVTVFLREPSPHHHDPAPAAPSRTTGPSTGTQTEADDVLMDKAEYSDNRSFFLPHLLVLIAAFLCAYYAEYLATEREVWATANDVARETVASWNVDRWGGVVGETISWEMERWCGVQRALIG